MTRRGREIPDPHAALSSQQLQELVAQALQSLTVRAARIIRLRFGLPHGLTHTLQQEGEKPGLTRERNRQIENVALRKLQDPARSKALREFHEH
jgi:RNA polymerase primary sigma factor